MKEFRFDSSTIVFTDLVGLFKNPKNQITFHQQIKKVYVFSPHSTPPKPNEINSKIFHPNNELSFNIYQLHCLHELHVSPFSMANLNFQRLLHVNVGTNSNNNFKPHHIEHIHKSYHLSRKSDDTFENIIQTHIVVPIIVSCCSM